jgi:hypothetical protein
MPKLQLSEAAMPKERYTTGSSAAGKDRKRRSDPVHPGDKDWDKTVAPIRLIDESADESADESVEESRQEARQGQ